MKLNMLKNEIQVLENLDSPYLLRVLAVHQSVNFLYIVTELCKGTDIIILHSNFSFLGDLENYIKQKGRLSEEKSLKILNQLVQGTKVMHDQNIIHRDIKPANILFVDNYAKIADFGFATHYKTFQNGYSVGTPLYMPPESYFLNHVSFKSDIWSLGAVFYQMLFGIAPFYALNEPDLVELLRQYGKEQKLKIPISVSQKSLSLLQSMLSFDYMQRPTIQELADIVEGKYVKQMSPLKQSPEKESPRKILKQVSLPSSGGKLQKDSNDDLIEMGKDLRLEQTKIFTKTANILFDNPKLKYLCLKGATVQYQLYMENGGKEFHDCYNRFFDFDKNNAFGQCNDPQFIQFYHHNFMENKCQIILKYYQLGFYQYIEELLLLHLKNQPLIKENMDTLVKLLEVYDICRCYIESKISMGQYENWVCVKQRIKQILS